ncbi:MAG: PilZ domain-containing protein [Spongiibacteraceae bacterium]
MDEQRRQRRTGSEALVEMSHPSFGRLELKATNLSDGGVFVQLGLSSPLPIGTVVMARIKRHTGIINQQPVAMQVVHHNNGGMGLMFV